MMDPWEKKKWAVVVVLVALCVGGSFWATRETVPEAAEIPSERPSVTVPADKPKNITIYISGAVREPGLYQVKPGIRYQEALAEAGGATEEADLTKVNLAKKCKDGSHVNVPLLKKSARKPVQTRTVDPTGGETPGTGTVNPAAEADSVLPPPVAAGRVNLNQAGVEELTGLPGIGPALARRIVEYRRQQPFRSPEDLQNVSGIGPSKFQRLRALVEV